MSPEPPLLERSAELGALDRVLAGVREGIGAVALIEGEPGIGKSALLRHMRARAQTSGLRVLSAGGVELDHALAFGVVRQLFLPAVAADPRLLEGPAGAARAALGLEGGTRGDAAAAAHALYWLTVAISESQPLLLIVDDFQWADIASRRALGALAARLEGLDVALVLGSRPHEGVALDLDQALRSPWAIELRPAPLSLEAVRRLSATSEAFAQACLELTGGVPFLVHELLYAIDAEGLPLGDEAIGPMRKMAPRAVGRSVLVRLQHVSAAAQALARAVVVMPRAVEPAFAASLAGIDPACCAAATAELVAAHVIAEGERLAVVHPVIRTTLYQDMPRQERARLHARAAGLLRATAGPLREEIAGHLLHAPPAGDPGVSRDLQRAGCAAMEAGAVEAAVRYLERALAEPPAPDERARVLADLGWAARTAGRADAVDHLRAAYDLARDTDTWATAIGRLVEVLVLDRADARQTEEVVRRALAEIDGGDEQHLRLLARLYYLVDRTAETNALCEAVIARIPADLDGGSPGRRACLVAQAIELTMQADPDVLQMRALLDRAGVDGTWADSDGVDWRVDAMNLAGALRVAGRLEQFAQLTASVAERLRRAGRSSDYAWTLAVHGWALTSLGRVEAAESAVETALTVLGDAAEGYPATVTRALSARTLVERAALDRAATVVEPIPEQTSHAELWRLKALAAVLVARGRLTAAAEVELRLAEVMRPMSNLLPANAEWGHEAAILLAALGRTGEAREILAERLDQAHRFGQEAAIGWLLRARGVVERDPEVAREAVATLARTEFALEHAKAVVDLGTVLHRRGLDREAREQLRAGLALAREHGALLLADRARSELIAAGGRAVDRPRRGPGSLTPAETRIAHLAAAGTPNKEIAQRLFITIRTVEMHLNNTYRKLGISSRRELASAFAGAA